jgi:hypothetical protein
MMGEELVPLRLHDLVDVCGVEGFVTTLIVKGDSARLMADKVEQKARIQRLQELQEVLPKPILVRPLVRRDVWGRLRLHDGHEAGLFSSSSAAGVD